MVRRFSSLDEVREVVGLELGPTPPLVITQDRIDTFARATGDFQWIHVEPERAAQSTFGSTIAHGYLTLSLVSQFFSQLFAVDFGTARINYGVNKVRFPTPVPVGSELVGRTTLTKIEERDSGYVLTFQHTVSIIGSDRPACVAEAIMLIVS